MRKSVITGIFACAILPLLSTVKADATSVDLINVTIAKPAIEQMIDAGDGSVSDLAILTSESVDTEVIVTIVTHTVTENENLSNIALLYSTTWKRVFDKNVTLENPDIINPGDELVIPELTEVLEERQLPEPVAIVPIATTRVSNSFNKASAQSATASTQNAQVDSSGNRYVVGYCTWFVKNLRPDLPNTLGDAITWVSRASALGLATGSTPVAGAVGQQGNHVVYVNSVNSDGTVTVSEMNFKGWNVKSSRTVAASNFRYIY